MLRILIADDHDLVRSGLRRIIEDHPGWEIVGEAADGQEAVRLAIDTKADVAVLDYSLPLLNGVEATPLRDVGITGKGVPLSAVAPLKPGPNVLEIVATDKAGNVTQVLRTVTRVGGKPSSGSPPASEPAR